MRSTQFTLPGIPQSLQEASLAFTKIEQAAWLALEELLSWHESYPNDECTAEAVKALREALNV